MAVARPDPGTHANRLQKHRALASLLAGLDDPSLAALLADALGAQHGFGGRTARLTVGDVPVFCKLVPLTSLEARPCNHRSTANLFGLPSYYQYGIGSVGFGAWRELAASTLASNWVLEGQHAQFPLLHHWRIVQALGATPVDAEAHSYLAHAAGQCHDESAIRDRLAALGAASTHIAMFSEHVPCTLSQWLIDQLHADCGSASAAIAWLEAQSAAAFAFMRDQNFVHFDAHFDNILTDGQHLYFADFGLAAHASFDLSPDERQFLARHAGYDALRFASSLVHTVCRVMPGDAGWREKLAQPEWQAASLPPAAVAALQRHAASASHLAQFAHTLIHTNRHAAFTLPTAAA